MAKKAKKKSKLDEVFRTEAEMKSEKTNKNNFGQRKGGLPDIVTRAALSGADYGSIVKLVDNQKKVRPKLTSSAKSHIVYVLKRYFGTSEKIEKTGITKAQVKHIGSLLEAAKTKKIKKTKKVKKTKK